MSEETRYQILDHTADVRVRVHGSALERLFENAAWALFDVIVDGLEGLVPTEEEPVSLGGADASSLLVDWMNDLLYRFDARGQIHAWPLVSSVNDSSLAATARFRSIDWSRDRFHTEVKSVTYHGLHLERRGDLWVAEVVFDL